MDPILSPQMSSLLHFLLESNVRVEKLKPSDFYFL